MLWFNCSCFKLLIISIIIWIIIEIARPSVLYSAPQKCSGRTNCKTTQHMWTNILQRYSTRSVQYESTRCDNKGWISIQFPQSITLNCDSVTCLPERCCWTKPSSPIRWVGWYCTARICYKVDFTDRQGITYKRDPDVRQKRVGAKRPGTLWPHWLTYIYHSIQLQKSGFHIWD